MEARGGAGGAGPSAGRRRRTALVVLLQLLPLLGLGGCSALWALTPIHAVLADGSALVFWSTMGLVGLLALLSLSWGLGYLYLGRRERLGCGLVLAGPVLLLICYGYIFNGFLVARTPADEAIRLRAMLWSALLATGQVLLMTWDAWRLARAAPEE